jgi:hemerythrin-like domain-containing protein
MDLTTNGVVVTDAIKYVQGQMDHLNKSEKSLLRDIKQKEGEVRGKEEDIGQQEQKTTNGIF